jgi:PAS domain S-box-containing protein
LPKTSLTVKFLVAFLCNFIALDAESEQVFAAPVKPLILVSRASLSRRGAAAARVDTSMQGLDNLTKGELLDLVRTLEHRLEHVEPDVASVTIDARPRLELAVSQALMQQRLASIVETSHDAILSWSLDGTLISWNDGAEALLGYSAEETLGKSLVMLMPPGDSTWEELTRAAAAGECVAKIKTGGRAVRNFAGRYVR